jgi:glycosyltransferase involved in cell wall biosynthesis
MFLYWGRRGLSRFAIEVTKAALVSKAFCVGISVSYQNENFAAFDELGEAVFPSTTFSTNVGALVHAWRIPLIRRQLLRHIATHRPEVIIELMPHVWSPFIVPAIKAAGVRYVTILHDGNPHPGDYRSASVNWFTKRTLRHAEFILTLSGAVAGRVEATGLVPREKIFKLFHPDLNFGGHRGLGPPRSGEPLRLLFFGRIMLYKGLPLFLDMVDELRGEGIAVEVGVFGEGDLGSSRARLEAMGAEVVNRWLTETEISTVLGRFHAIVLSHVEASQSGVAAAAFGADLPVIATPVGGIIEQVQDKITGVLASRADAAALAESAKRLMFEPGLYHQICQNIVALKANRSMARFVEECVSLLLHDRPAPNSSTRAN